MSKPKSLPSYIDARDFGAALFDLLMKAGTDDSTIQEEVDKLEQIKPGIKQIGNPKTRAALISLVESIQMVGGKGDKGLAEARKRIEMWFDTSMQRATGWYKRAATWRGTLLGLILAVAVNADAIGISQTLWRDEALRDSIVAASTVYLERGRRAECNRSSRRAGVARTAAGVVVGPR